MPARPSPISCVVGRYALGPEIARGGLATVHLGLTLGEAGFARTVAIKRLLPAFARDPDLVPTLIDEARLAARIRHPNVVPTLDIVTQDGELFVVMEYVHGESLAELLRAAARSGTRIPFAVVSAIVVNVLAGLQAAHEARDEGGALLDVVHRDISPQNVLVGADGVARVLDFGIAKAAGRSQVTREGQVKGKLGYLAPEQLRQNAERASDIYATGVCLWEALTMRRLFSGDNESAVLAKIMAGLVDPPSKYVPHLPPALDAITLRALQRRPAERFATARDMAQALESAVAPATISAVGAWVDSLAAPSLARRAERIAEIEAFRVPPPRPIGLGEAFEPPSQRGSVEPPAPPVEPIAPTLLDVDARPPAARHRMVWMASGGLCAVLASVAIIAGVVRGARAHAGQDEGAPASASPPMLADPGPPAGVPSASASSAAVAPEPVPSATASSSQPPAAAVTRPRARPAAAVAPRANCDPPYSMGPDGVRRYKKQCLK